MSKTRMVNLAAALLIVLGNLIFWAHMATYVKPTPAPVDPGVKMVYEPPPARDWTVETVGIVMCVLGSLTLFVDALRRPKGPSTLGSYAATLLGAVFLGIPALLYYAMIGWREAGETDEIFGKGFCRECLTSTSNVSAGNTFTVNLIWGTRLMGSGMKCKTCGSVVKTKWFLMGLPVLPMGSYRVVSVGHKRFLSRKTDLNWGQVGMGLSAWAVLLIGVAVCFGYMYATKK